MSTEYPVGFHFELTVNGEDTAFQEVSGLSKELNIEEETTGGENRFLHRLPAISSSQNLVVKRAIISENSKLIKWCSNTLDNGMSNPIQTQEVKIKLLDKDSIPLMQWNFYKAYPVKFVSSDLSSQESEILIVSIEFAYAYFDISNNTEIKNQFD